MDRLEHERPYANELIGAHSTGPVTGGADWICALPDHWIFAGTGMKKGDGIPGLVGWEWHGDPAKIPGLEIVATGPTQDSPGKPNGGIYTATVYPGPKGNFVFNASTCWWADGLSAGLSASVGLHHPPRPGPARPADHAERAGADADVAAASDCGHSRLNWHEAGRARSLVTIPTELFPPAQGCEERVALALSRQPQWGCGPKRQIWCARACLG
jgi:hypothetical protein